MKIKENNIGEILRLLRISNDLSISELSKKTSISKSYISELEKGKKIPSSKILKCYSVGLELPEETINYLLKDLSQQKFSYKKRLLKILEETIDIEKNN